MLSERLAFPALPGLEFAVSDYRERFGRLACLIVKSTKLNREIVASAHQVKMGFELVKPVAGWLAGPLPQLIALEKKPSVTRLGAKRLFISTATFGVLAKHVEIGDTKVTPSDCIRGLETDRILPAGDSFARGVDDRKEDCRGRIARERR